MSASAASGTIAGPYRRPFARGHGLAGGRVGATGTREFDITIEDIVVHVTHKRVKRFNLRIAPDGSAQISVPLGTPIEEVRAVAAEHVGWFREQLARAAEYRRQQEAVSRLSHSPATTSPYEIDVDGITVIVRPKRVKNFNMHVNRDGVCEMSVPIGATREQVMTVAQKWKYWFKKHSASTLKRVRKSPVEWADGEFLRVWGTDRALVVEEASGPERCELTDDELHIHMNRYSTPVEREAVVEHWLERELQAYVNKIMADCCRRVGATPKTVTYRRMKSRWGSCTKGRGSIRLNVALAECPPRCTEVVLCHELCHLIEANHGAHFYQLLDAACPDWRQWQRLLDETGPRCP